MWNDGRRPARTRTCLDRRPKHRPLHGLESVLRQGSWHSVFESSLRAPAAVPRPPEATNLDGLAPAPTSIARLDQPSFIYGDEFVEALEFALIIRMPETILFMLRSVSFNWAPAHITLPVD